MKIGLIRCMQTEELCPATRCLDAMRKKKDAFADVEGGLELVGVTTCGGCPGKKAGLRAAMMLRRGAQAIALASCITKGTPIDYACPFAARLAKVVRAAVGDDVPIFAYTHAPAKKKAPAASAPGCCGAPREA
ncbi:MULTISPECIES: CGGC domain-containing protein [unclassified Desulfovibrio]|uniref:CGGC domain-containing protein n=1 Tax=unclassified Desulfovibrio TaxID=2593640 RepID=UPI0013EDECB3|nr:MULTISPECIES: CGGC domain-containing protein [unclassified Desulfovibrio]MBD5627612.1 CGGC domain-containing protein [Desulfovibrio sp.]